MRVLIVDQDSLSSQLIRSKLEGFDHQVTEVSKRDEGIKALESESFDIVFVDPSPATSVQPFVVNARRAAGQHIYIVLMGQSPSLEEALKAGCNDVLGKPFDASAIEKKQKNADHMVSLTRHMGDTSEDFPSAGGVIAKSAFNQLFLSAMDRGNRYGDESFVLFFTITNYQDILEMDGNKAADYSSAMLARHLVRVRRQSDIIGQTRKYQYALLLQRPENKQEPIEAAARFAQSLGESTEISALDAAKIEITIQLIDLPIGAVLAEHQIL